MESFIRIAQIENHKATDWVRPGIEVESRWLTEGACNGKPGALLRLARAGRQKLFR